jgi:hypothetical protein
VKIREFLDTAFLCWFSQPAPERLLYRLIRRYRIGSIVELGLRDPARSVRLIRLATRYAASGRASYAGIDQFEARPDDQPRLTLKQAHRVLSRTGASVRLIPGDSLTALSYRANQLMGTQLLLISQLADTPELAKAWFYVPRMLAEPRLVLLQGPSKAPNLAAFRRVYQHEIRGWVQAAGRPDRSAA